MLFETENRRTGFGRVTTEMRLRTRSCRSLVTCDSTWIFASFQAISRPLCQILSVGLIMLNYNLEI